MVYTPKHHNNFSVSDIRILKILAEMGPLTKQELGTEYIAHVRGRNLTGFLNPARLIYLMEQNFINSKTMKVNGLPETVYQLFDTKALQRYIDAI